MARTLFVCSYKNGGIVLPPMISDSGGLRLAEIVGGKIRDGCGWTCIGNVPVADSVIALVDSSVATITALKNSPDYVFLEDVPDAEA